MVRSVVLALLLPVYLQGCGESAPSQPRDLILDPGFKHVQIAPLWKFFEDIDKDVNVAGEAEYHKVSTLFHQNCDIKYRATFEDKTVVTRRDENFENATKHGALSYKVQLLAYEIEQDPLDVGALNSRPWGSILTIPYSIYLEFKERRQAEAKSSSIEQLSSSRVAINSLKDFRYENSPFYDSATKPAHKILLGFMLDTEACVIDQTPDTKNDQDINAEH